MGEDRDCLDAHVELLELGDSNRIIVSQDVSSPPEVPKRKTSDPKAPPHLSTTRIPPFLCYPPSSTCMNEQPVMTTPRTVDTNVTLAAAAHCSHHGSSKKSVPMTNLSPKRRRWRRNKLHTVGLLVNVVLFCARGACALQQWTHQSLTLSGHNNHIALRCTR